MTVSFSAPISFKGKSIEVKEMEKLVRLANREYPRISPWRVEGQVNKKGLGYRFKSWVRRIGGIVDEQRSETQYRPFYTMIAEDTKAIKQNRLGDCGESSELMMSTLLANGIKDGKIGRLFFKADAIDMYDGEVVATKMLDTTHEFVVRHYNPSADTLNPKTYGKDLIVLDAWSGFCGNMQEAFKHYYDTFMNGMREFINKEHGVKITYKPCFRVENIPDASDKVAESFKAEFPNLVLKGK